MSLSNLFGGGDTTNKQTTSNALSQDMRTAVEGDVGSLISPGAAVATPGGGAVNAAPGANVAQTITNTGMTATDITALMANLDADHAQERAAISRIVGDTTAAMREGSAQVADILAATKTPDSNTLTQVLPLLLLLAVLWFLTR